MPQRNFGRSLYKTLSILLLLGLIGAACNAQNTPTGAASEDEITVYSSIPGDLVNTYLADFKATHPAIKVNLVDEVTLDLVNRLLTEQDDPQADVIWGLAVSSMLTLEWNYLLTAYAPVGLNRLDPIFLDGKQPPQWTGISARSIALCVNLKELRDRRLPVPISWQDLVKPVYKGQLLILSPGQTSVGYLLISTILQLYGDVEGWEYLAQLHDNVEGVYANNARSVCQPVLHGEYPIGLTYDYRASFPDDLSMLLVLPVEGVGWDMEVNGLVRKENINPAAKVFLDWAISDGAMQQYAEDRMIISAANALAPTQALNARRISSHLFDLDIAWVAANRERIQQEWMDLYGSDIKLIDTSQ